MELIAQKREELRKKVADLRKNRIIPGVLFGKGLDSLSVSVDFNSFVKVYAESGENALVDLNVDGKKDKVLIKDVQFDPITSKPIHAGFHKVNLKEKITAEIPVELVGASEHPLVKSGEALILTLLSEISVEALPTDLPANFEINVLKLEKVGDGITVSELVYDHEKVEVQHEPDEFVVKLDSAQMAEEPVEAEVSEEEAIAKVEATEELSDEEKAKRAEEAAKAKE
jgi:large subunit ribosomal protein L25